MSLEIALDIFKKDVKNQISKSKRLTKQNLEGSRNVFEINLKNLDEIARFVEIEAPLRMLKKAVIPISCDPGDEIPG